MKELVRSLRVASGGRYGPSMNGGCIISVRYDAVIQSFEEFRFPMFDRNKLPKEFGESKVVVESSPAFSELWITLRCGTFCVKADGTISELGLVSHH